MNKQDFIAQLAENRFEGDKKEAEYALDSVLDGLLRAMVEEDEISIFGFGKFTIREVPGRTGRNPQTGEPVEIAPSVRVSWKPAANIKKTLNSDDDLVDFPAFAHKAK